MCAATLSVPRHPTLEAAPHPTRYSRPRVRMSRSPTSQPAPVCSKRKCVFLLFQAGLDLKDNLPPGAGAWPYPSVYHPYDAAFAGYPFNG